MLTVTKISAPLTASTKTVPTKWVGGQLRQKFLMKLIEEGIINESQILGISSSLCLAIHATKVQENIPWRNVGIQNSGTLDSVINTE